MRKEPRQCRDLQIKNNVAESVIPEVVPLNTGENDRSHTGWLGIRNGWPDVKFDSLDFALDLIADDAVIVE
jgi:hypothetical protein